MQEMWLLIPGSDNMPWRKECLPTQHSCLENPMDRRAWQAIVHSVSKESDMTERQQHRCIKYMKIPIFLSLFVQTQRKTKTHKNKRVIKTLKEKKIKSCAVFQSRLLFKRANELEICNSEKNTIKQGIDLPIRRPLIIFAINKMGNLSC